MCTTPGTYMNYLTSSSHNSVEKVPFHIFREVKKLVKGQEGTSCCLTPKPFIEAAWLSLWLHY